MRPPDVGSLPTPPDWREAAREAHYEFIDTRRVQRSSVAFIEVFDVREYRVRYGWNGGGHRWYSRDHRTTDEAIAAIVKQGFGCYVDENGVRVSITTGDGNGAVTPACSSVAGKTLSASPTTWNSTSRRTSLRPRRTPGGTSLGCGGSFKKGGLPGGRTRRGRDG